MSIWVFLVIVAFLVLFMGIVTMISPSLKSKRYENTARLIETLLMTIRDKTLLSRMTDVIGASDGTLGRATLYGKDFYCQCMWPSCSVDEIAGDAHPLSSLTGYIVLAENPSLQENLALLNISQEESDRVTFELESDGCGNEQVRMQHGIYAELKILRKDGSIAFEQTEIVRQATLRKSLHDSLFQEVVSAVRASI